MRGVRSWILDSRVLLPAAAVALERGFRSRGDGVTLLLDDQRVDASSAGRTPRPRRLAAAPPARASLRRAGNTTRRHHRAPPPRRRRRLHPAPKPAAVGGIASRTTGPGPPDPPADPDETSEADVLAALLAWAARFTSLETWRGRSAAPGRRWPSSVVTTRT